MLGLSLVGYMTFPVFVLQLLTFELLDFKVGSTSGVVCMVLGVFVICIFSHDFSLREFPDVTANGI